MIQFNFEPWADFYSDPGLPDLLLEHWKELGKGHGYETPFQLHAPAYAEMERAGTLLVLVARRDGLMVGYSLAVLTQHLHYPILVGFDDMFFLTREVRGNSIGRNMVERMVSELRSRGAQKQLWSAKHGTAACALLESLGMKLQDNAYRLEN